MIRRFVLCSALALLSLPSLAANLTTAQLQTLKAAIALETNPTFVTYRQQGATGAMADWYNLSSTFVVWKTSVALALVGKNFNGTELAGLTTGNQQRLQTIGVYFDQGVDPSRADVRQMFDDIFSGAGGTNTRASLLALWKRFATNGEKVYATGLGLDATPGTLVFEGSITNQNIIDALNS